LAEAVALGEHLDTALKVAKMQVRLKGDSEGTYVALA